MDVGIEKIGLSLPRLFVDSRDLSVLRGWNPNKIVLGLGIKSLGVPEQYEDSVSLAANAARHALDQGIKREEIGRLVVATETGVDSAKPISAYLHQLLGLDSDTEIYEVKHACVGGVYALCDSLDWIRAGQNQGRKALVVCTDIARYARGSPAEPTQSAGAVALLVSDKPSLIRFEGQTGTYSENVSDFWRPLNQAEAVVNGKYSLECYTKAVLEAYYDLKRKRKIEFDKFVFHTPFPRLVKKVMSRILLEEGKTGELEEEVQERVGASLNASSQLGNIYTGSIFLALASLLDLGLEDEKQLALLSYGSGCSSKALIGVRGNQGLGFSLESMLSNRMRICAEDYDSLIYGDLDNRIQNPSGFFLSGVSNGYRSYGEIK